MPAQLAHYPTDDNVYRLAVCEQCRRYLKTIDLREVAGERYLAAERILTVGLDAAAEEARLSGRTMMGYPSSPEFTLSVLRGQ